jgi:hypothetical protein
MGFYGMDENYGGIMGELWGNYGGIMGVLMGRGGGFCVD